MSNPYVGESDGRFNFAPMAGAVQRTNLSIAQNTALFPVGHHFAATALEFRVAEPAGMASMDQDRAGLSQRFMEKRTGPSVRFSQRDSNAQYTPTQLRRQFWAQSDMSLRSGGQAAAYASYLNTAAVPWQYAVGFRE